MLTVAEINAHLRSAVAYTYVGNEFTTTSPDDCALVRISGGYAPSEWTSKANPGFQIVVRSKLPAVSETTANALFTYLHGKVEFNFGSTRVVKCTANQSAPWWLGKDSSNRTEYSLNFTLTTI